VPPAANLDLLAFFNRNKALYSLVLGVYELAIFIERWNAPMEIEVRVGRPVCSLLNDLHGDGVWTRAKTS
jgi:hypothetical protein